MNGGLPLWEKENGQIETNAPEPVQAKTYKVPKINQALVRDYAQVLQNAKNIQDGKSGAQVLDARPYPRFTGEAPEPRQGLSSGHMPGSISVAFNEVVQSGEMLSDDQLRKVFESKGVDTSKEIVTSCGSGITASILYLALERIGAQNLAVYDGSWTEYAGKSDALINKSK